MGGCLMVALLSEFSALARIPPLYAKKVLSLSGVRVSFFW